MVLGQFRMPYGAASPILRRRPKARPRKTGRADIQGLRTLAVLAVIADHALHWPSGGFVGVDIFLVISGFLITGLLLREYDRTGKISFAAFYKRRVKRILPAATLVIVATLAASYIVFSSARFGAIVLDAAWASLFSANWRFAAVGTDYFQSGGPVSPLQHYWSLAVEEQFYFIWPAVMLGILWLVAKAGLRQHGRRAVGAAIVLLSVASFTWAMVETTSNPTQAYFSTFSRAWELGIGATLAIIAPSLSRLPSALRPLLAWAGLAGIVAALFVIGGASPFPAPTAALPVVATAMVIMSGTGGLVPGLWPLTNRGSQYIGDISYSLYLVHFPVLILAAEVLDLSNGWIMTAVLAAVFILAMYQYHLFEDWIRKSSWLGPKAKGKESRPLFTQPYKYAALSLLILVTAGVTVPQLRSSPPTYVVAPVAPVAPVAGLAGEASTVPPEMFKLQSEILSATGATEWPTLSPTMDEAIESTQTVEEIGRCGQQGALVDEDACSWGNPEAANTAVLVGDSTSMAYVATIRAALAEDTNWKVVSYGTFGCPFYQLPGAEEEGRCADRRADAVAAIKRINPAVVFVTNHYDGRTMPNTKEPVPQEVLTSAIGTMVSSFIGDTSKVVFLAPPPTDKNPVSCYTRFKGPADCMGSLTSKWQSAAKLEQELAGKLGAEFIDSRDWFCINGKCPIFAGETPIKRDFVHITSAYQVKIGPVVLEALKAGGIV